MCETPFLDIHRLVPFMRVCVVFLGAVTVKHAVVCVYRMCVRLHDFIFVHTLFTHTSCERGLLAAMRL